MQTPTLPGNQLNTIREFKTVLTDSYLGEWWFKIRSKRKVQNQLEFLPLLMDQGITRSIQTDLNKMCSHAHMLQGAEIIYVHVEKNISTFWACELSTEGIGILLITFSLSISISCSHFLHWDQYSNLKRMTANILSKQFNVFYMRLTRSVKDIQDCYIRPHYYSYWKYLKS